MAREKRNNMIRFVVTSDEKSEFETAALNARQSLSEWLRGAARRAMRDDDVRTRVVEANKFRGV